MTRRPRLSLLARWLLHLSPLPREARADVESDLRELFDARRHDQGLAYAHWRLYRDVASLWRQPRPERTASRRPALSFLRDARADLSYAVRLFARQPAILLLAIVGLSLGLGVATAAFSILNVAALSGEGFIDPDRAPGVLKRTDRSESTAWTYGEFLQLRDGATRMQVEALFTTPARVATAAPDADAPQAVLAFVSGGFFEATGGGVIAGRPLARADERHDGPPPVVISFVFWTSRLNRDPAIVGRTIWIGRTTATVVGVAARGFTLPRGPALWMPLTAYGAVRGATRVTRASDLTVEVFGRLAPGVTLAEAEGQLSGVAGAMPGPAPAGDSPPGVRLDPEVGLGRDSRSDGLAITVFVLAAIVLVLLLACANVASVLISTAITREREMAVRAALGASRGRIVRQLVTESLALGAIAAALGLVLTYWSLPVIGRMIDAPAVAHFAPDLNVYLFLAIATFATGVIAGLAPARHGRDADLVTPIKGGEHARANRTAPRRLRATLVMTQAAVSVLLMVVAALFVRATFRTAAIDVGFDAAGLHAVSLESADTDPTRTRSLWTRAITELQTMPGVDSVTLTELAPFAGESKTAITREAPARVVHFNRVSGEYFATLGLRLLSGRTFTRDETATNAPVALVSRSLARAYFGDTSPLGQALPPAIPVTATRPVIIGVVTDAITTRLYERNTLAFYEPLDPANEPFARLLIRVSPGAADAIDRAGARLRALDPDLEIRIADVGDRLRRAAAQPRMLATLSGVVGVVAIVLCVIGLYGLTASVVGQRRREMGVRVALGARPHELLRLLLWDSLRPVVIGLGAGAAATLIAGQIVAAAIFFGVSPRDPMALAGAVLILLAAATLAVLAPTRRAAAVDPASILRS